MALKLYYTLMSQPCRSLYILLKLNNIPFEECPVKMEKGEHLSKEFKEKVSRFQRLPVINDKGFFLTESIAILRYLTREYKVEDFWYPKDSKLQARVDEYLQWHHLNTRLSCSNYFRDKWMLPNLLGKTPNPETVALLEKHLKKTFKDIETLWLRNNKYIGGGVLTAADVFAACELEQPRLAGFDPSIDYPILTKWLNTVRSELDPTYSEAHAFLNKLIAKDAKKKEATQ